MYVYVCVLDNTADLIKSDGSLFPGRVTSLFFFIFFVLIIMTSIHVYKFLQSQIRIDNYTYL